MSCRGFRHLLVLLDDDEAATWPVMERAVELAEVERARMTIAKTTDPGWIVRWFAPLTMLGRCGPMVWLDTAPQHTTLDRATAYVPASIPLTRVLLPTDTACALRRLARSGCFDLLIARDGLLARHRSVRREVRRLGLSTLSVCADSANLGQDPGATGSASVGTDPGATGPLGSAHSASGLV